MDIIGVIFKRCLIEVMGIKYRKYWKDLGKNGDGDRDSKYDNSGWNQVEQLNP